MLPRTCNPDLLASRGARLCGALPASGLRRLLGAVDHAVGPVRATLDFERDEAGLARIAGRLEVPIQLTCQRCLAPLEVLLNARVDILVVHSEKETERCGQGREVAQMQGDSLLLHEMIEEELILALPMHASHPRGSCSSPTIPSSPSAASEAPPSNPFAALATLTDPSTTRGDLMAVSQRKKSTSRRDMRRAHQALRSPTLSEDSTTGEKHLRHHISPDGYYRGRKVLETGDE